MSFYTDLSAIDLPTVEVDVTQNTLQEDINATIATVDSSLVDTDENEIWGNVSQNTTWFSFKVADLEREFEQGDTIEYNSIVYEVTGHPKTGEINNYTLADRSRVKVYAFES